MSVFIEGHKISDDIIHVPLESAALINLLQYCRCQSFTLSIVGFESDSDKTTGVLMPISALDGLNCSFLESNEVEKDIMNCCFPVVKDNTAKMIRSGLGGIARNIIKVADQDHPQEDLIDLLGFRKGSLKACSEVSGWTKLCEIELPVSLEKLMSEIQTCVKSDDGGSVTIPADLLKLELHFEKPPPMHNDDKKRRSLLKEIQKTPVESQVDNSHKIDTFFHYRNMEKTHGDMKYRVLHKAEQKADQIMCKFGCTQKRITKWCAKCNDREKLIKRTQEQQRIAVRAAENTLDGNDRTKIDQSSTDVIESLDELSSYIESLTLHDIEFAHLYAEGIGFTLADLIVFVYIYHLLESLDFKPSNLFDRLPCIRRWLQHLTTLPRLVKTAVRCGFKLDLVMDCVGNTNINPNGSYVHFKMEDVVLEEEEDQGEISRRNRSKQKALRPELARILQKVKDSKVTPTVGEHPCGTAIHVDWESVPREASLKDELPEKRVPRKCQQLENLATAVKSISKPGDVIVDFCSGGGHLGIIIAYLLPECQVHLVENKEESLLRAKTRVEKLNLKNITLYQCNMDYYKGQFDIGVCLHACGVATDMVLQQCIDRKAGFVICPCCYGGIQVTHLIQYPRSQLFTEAAFTDKELIILGHAADYTDFNQQEYSSELVSQGRLCMNLVDMDRSTLAREHGYNVTLCYLQPLNCTPKNNLLIGTPAIH